eukprot:1905392-Amphidinium_carterae.1
MSFRSMLCASLSQVGTTSRRSGGLQLSSSTAAATGGAGGIPATGSQPMRMPGATCKGTCTCQQLQQQQQHELEGYHRRKRHEEIHHNNLE